MCSILGIFFRSFLCNLLKNPLRRLDFNDERKSAFFKKTVFYFCTYTILMLFFPPPHTDTENIRFVFAAVKDTILQQNLKEYNLV